MIGVLAASVVFGGFQSIPVFQGIRYENVEHALPDGSPDRSARSNSWVEVQRTRRQATVHGNGLNEPFVMRSQISGRGSVNCFSSGKLPLGAAPFTLPPEGTKTLLSQLPKFIFITNEPIPAMTNMVVFQVVETRTEVESRTAGKREALRYRVSTTTIGFDVEYSQVKSAKAP